MKLSSSLFLYATLVLVTITVNAEISTIAKIGEPAADFSSDYVYSNLKNPPAIGGGGHVAFIGTAGTKNGQSQDAVWSGKPGQLRTLIRKDETPNGFLANTVFSFAYPGTLIVSDSGSVAFEANMNGSSDGRSYLAAVDGITYGIIRRNSPAPGFPAGTSILALFGFVFTDAGMAFSGTTTTGELAIWLWKNSTLKLVVSSGNELTDLYPGCSIEGIFLNDLNQNGELLFFASFEFSRDVSCPVLGLLTWKEGIFKKIVTYKEPVPGFPVGSFFSNVLLGSFLGHNSISDNGNVSFSATISDESDSLPGFWVARNNGNIEPVALVGELLPNLSSRISTISTGIASNTNTFTVSKTSGEIILVGSPKQGASYSDLDNLGESHLKVLVHPNLQPPGFDDTWFFNKLGEPLLNNHDTVAFRAEVRDALDPNFSSTRGIWLGDNKGDLRLLLAEGIPVKIDGVNKTLSRISDISLALSPLSTNSGLPNQLNDNDELVFMGAKEGSRPDTIFYSGKSSGLTDCTASYKSNGLLNIPCVTVPNVSGGTTLYQANMKLIPLSNPFSFELTDAQQKGNVLSTNTCVSIYKADGSLSIPCVTVPNISGSTTMYQAELKLILQSNPFTFNLFQAQQVK